MAVTAFQRELLIDCQPLKSMDLRPYCHWRSHQIFTKGKCLPEGIIRRMNPCVMTLSLIVQKACHLRIACFHCILKRERDEKLVLCRWQISIEVSKPNLSACIRRGGGKSVEQEILMCKWDARSGQSFNLGCVRHRSFVSLHSSASKLINRLLRAIIAIFNDS